MSIEKTELQKLEIQQEQQKVEKSKKEKLAESDRLSKLAVKVQNDSSPASQILAYVKNNPATTALATASAGALATGSPWMAAAMGAAAYMGAGKSLDSASTGTQLMAAAAAASYISGHPIIAAGLGVAAYAGVGKDFFKSAQDAKAENPADGDPGKSAKEIASNVWDQAMQKMGFGGVAQKNSENETLNTRERQRG